MKSKHRTAGMKVPAACVPDGPFLVTGCAPSAAVSDRRPWWLRQQRCARDGRTPDTVRPADAVSRGDRHDRRDVRAHRYASDERPLPWSFRSGFLTVRIFGLTTSLADLFAGQFSAVCEPLMTGTSPKQAAKASRLMYQFATDVPLLRKRPVRASLARGSARRGLAMAVGRRGAGVVRRRSPSRMKQGK
jgi:hypothetical protein